MTADAESFRQVFDRLQWRSVQGFEQDAVDLVLIVGSKLAIYWDISTDYLGKVLLVVRFESGVAASTIKHHGQQSLRFFYKTFRITL